MTTWYCTTLYNSTPIEKVLLWMIHLEKAYSSELFESSGKDLAILQLKTSNPFPTSSHLSGCNSSAQHPRHCQFATSLFGRPWFKGLAGHGLHPKITGLGAQPTAMVTDVKRKMGITGFVKQNQDVFLKLLYLHFFSRSLSNWNHGCNSSFKSRIPTSVL